MTCPQCGSSSVAVPGRTVRYMLKDAECKQFKASDNYFLCTSPVCKTAYFSNEMIFDTDSLSVKIWYKNEGDYVPVCYCSDLTRGEIKHAVKNGCRTIADVRKYTGKNITGQCAEKNPVGKCCGNVFVKEIEKVLASYKGVE